MSSSDDDVPLGQAFDKSPMAKQAPQAPNAAVQAAKQGKPPAPKQAASYSSGSEEDIPLAQRSRAQPVHATGKPPAGKRPASADNGKVSTTSGGLSQLEGLQQLRHLQAQAAKRQKTQADAKAGPASRPAAGKSASKPAGANAKAKAAAVAVKTEAASPGKTADVKPKVKREKKVYELPGQTKDTPEETDSLRKFYTSLLEQRPESEMAKKWLLQHGLIPEDEVEGVMDELGSVKSPAGKRKTSAAPSKPRIGGGEPKKPKRKRESNGAPDGKGNPATSAAKATAGTAPKQAAAKRPGSADGKPQLKRPKAKQDVAFRDGGNDSSSSEDDVPLAQRTVTAP